MSRHASVTVKMEPTGSSMIISSWTCITILCPRIGDESHGVDEEVAGDRLHDVLDEFPAVGFQPPPLPTRGDTAVGDRRATPPVLTQPRLHIRQPPTRRESVEQDARLHAEAKVAQPDGSASGDRVQRRLLDIRPELHDVWVRCPPGIDDGFELVLGEPHPQRTHGLQCSDGAVVAAGQRCDLPFLA